MSNVYKDYRTQIKSGDLLVWTEKRFTTFADIAMFFIQLFTRSRYDHTAVAWVVGDRVLCIEARVPKVQVTEVSSKTNFYHLSVPAEWKEEYAQFLLSKVGLRYGFMNILKRALGFKNVDPYEQFCSQLVAEFYEKIGYTKTDELGWTPEDVVEGLLLKTGNGLVKVITDQGED